ncbi:MOSC domain-containing protein, partial [Thalassospira xiamenensis]
MSPLQELLADVPQVGQVRWIGVRPKAREAMLEV